MGTLPEVADFRLERFQLRSAESKQTSAAITFKKPFSLLPPGLSRPHNSTGSSRPQSDRRPSPPGVLVNGLTPNTCALSRAFRGVTFADAGLVNLMVLRKLKRLELTGGWASVSAVNVLRKALPDCTIDTKSEPDADE